MLTLDRLLNEIDQSVTSSSRTIDIVAKDNKLFLNRTTDFNVKRLSLKDLIELFVTVKDLLATLRRASHRSRVKRVCEGNEILDVTLDETYVANLEHLLLCLQDQLIRLLITSCVELVHKHLIESQKDRYKHCEDWFFEFPDSRHPLSTTWPWSIRPSLAVIWGVCWMFYDLTNFANLDDQELLFDDQWNLVDARGNVLYSSQVVSEALNAITMGHSPGECTSFLLHCFVEDEAEHVQLILSAQQTI